MFSRSGKKRARSPAEPSAQQPGQQDADRTAGTVPAQREAERESSGGEAIPPVSKMEGGPDNPLELSGTGWLNTLKRTGKKFSQDRCTMAAGSLAYSWFFALFPALVAAIGVVSLINLDVGQINHLINGLDKALPSSAADVFDTAVKNATNKSKGALTTVIIGVVLALWSSSSGMVALETALDVAYEVPQSAKFVKKRLRAFILIGCTVVLGGIASIFIVEGAPLGNALASLMSVHNNTGFTVIWTIVRWVLTIILISLLFSCYYYFGPNREMPKWQWVSPGGLVGTIIFLVASLGFSFYISKFGDSSYSKTYGALAGVVILIFWLYLAGIAVLVGGEINAEAERQAAAQAGHPGAQQSAAAVQEGSASPSSNTASS